MIFCEKWSHVLLRQFRQGIASIAGQRPVGIGLRSVFSCVSRRVHLGRGDLSSGVHGEETKSDRLRRGSFRENPVYSAGGS